MIMEVIEYLPGALAAIALVVRIAIFFRDGPEPEQDQQDA
ncbi:hypothetical protein BN2497_10083 [Janthinobacterium sp. CG23_2]|nr:hypothetical protein BN2497_10083 [Janthinobacterium sp. CG23_2]CUU31439.1 hypothetical protein BN3177_10083 [Janthinobacterium sp. CG23_2]